VEHLAFKQQKNGTDTHTHTNTHNPVCEYGDVTVLSYQGVNTDRDVTANRPNMTIQNKKEKICIIIEVEILAGRESHAKGNRKRS
jgi:hypothetical protein